MVGRLTLDQEGGGRIPTPQPQKPAGNGGFRWVEQELPRRAGQHRGQRREAREDPGTVRAVMATTDAPTRARPASARPSIEWRCPRERRDGVSTEGRSRAVWAHQGFSRRLLASFLRYPRTFAAALSGRPGLLRHPEEAVTKSSAGLQLCVGSVAARSLVSANAHCHKGLASARSFTALIAAMACHKPVGGEPQHSPGPVFRNDP
jgi:hypothetical protein